MSIEFDQICVFVDTGDDEPTIYGPFGGWPEANDFCRHLGVSLNQAKVLRNPALWPDGFDAEMLP